MKSKDAGLRGTRGGRRPPPGPMRVDLRMDLRMEWMDPMSWRLPSGKALAEFALQAGFLAPLMLMGPKFKRPKKPAGPAVEAVVAEKSLERLEEQLRGEPERSGTFRETK